MRSGAIISNCGLYRYLLWRIWDASLPVLPFIQLNPSTADAQQDDPTLRRDMGFARDSGYGGTVLANLFAYRATSPAVMKKAAAPIGPDNDGHLADLIMTHDIIVCAWGANGSFRNRDQHVLKMFAVRGKVPHCLRLSPKSRMPEHPLYLPADLRPVPFIRLELASAP